MAPESRGIPKGLAAFIARADEPVFLREQVADALNVSSPTLRILQKQDPGLGPSHSVRYRQGTYYLYDEARVAVLRRYCEQRWPERVTGKEPLRLGRPRMWNGQERAEREARRCHVHYLRTAARRSAERGLIEVAADYRRQADSEHAAMRAEYAERFAYVTRAHVR